MSVTGIHPPTPTTREVVMTSLREESATWLFVFKSLLAFYLTGWLAMRLALPQPSTAMLTTIIVANRQTGMVLAKSFYRAIGTLIGALAAFLIVGLFPQQRVLFLGALSLWIGLCAGGATLYRNFKAYSFVLAGYTAAIVALPVIDNPPGVFDSAVARLSEVLLGLGVSGAVSDLVFPSRIRDDMRRMARAQYANFIEFMQRALGGGVARADIENAYLRFVRDSITLEDLRSSVIFEDPEARARSGHIMLFNQRFMAASTSMQSLHHLINRLKRYDHHVPADALIKLYKPIGEALNMPIEAGTGARVLLPRLDTARRAMSQQAPVLRERLTSPIDLLDFDTGARLLDHFADELYAYVDTASALQAPEVIAGKAERVQFERGNDYIGSSLALLRTTLTMGALSLFWINSAWPFGSSAMLLATIFAGLFASTPNPAQSVKATTLGYLLGMSASFVCVFAVLTHMDGFTLLVAGTAPFLMVGLVMIAVPSTTRIGVGYCMGFAYILAAQNQMSFDVMHFLNDMIAQLIGLSAAGVAFVFVPPAIGTLWYRQRQLERLRRQVGVAATAPLIGLRSRFESLNHDLFGQIVAQTEPGSHTSRSMLAWALSVHEVGRTLIQMRTDMATRRLTGEIDAAINNVITALTRLYDQPSAAAYLQARDVLTAAIATTARDASAHPVLDYLNLLRLALLDGQSVLAEYMPNISLPAGASDAT